MAGNPIKPNPPAPKTLLHHEPSRSSGRNGDTASARQHPCRRADLPHLDCCGMDSRHVSPVMPPEMETLHRFHHRGPDPQTPHHRSRVARHSVGHPRTPATLLGTEGCRRLLLQRRRSSAWDLRAIFRLAAQDRLLPSNPAEMLFTPPTVATPSRWVLTPEQVQQILQV